MIDLAIIPTKKTIRALARRSLPFLAAPLIVLACGDSPTDDGFDAPTDGASVLSVYLTDAPGDVSRVWVEVTDVVLVGADGGPLSLLDEPTELIEVTALQNGEVAALVQELEVELGSYRQVRFVVGGAVLETVGGDVYVQGGAEHPEAAEATGTLLCPSCSQTGFKVLLPGDLVVEEGENGLLMDFDVTRSFGHQAGQSGMWVMHPVIHGGAADPDEIEAGEAELEITGTVSLAEGVEIPVCGDAQRSLEEFVPVATATTLEDEEGGALAFTGETDADGAFELQVLGADTYDLGHLGETAFDGEKLVWTVDEVSPVQVTVEAGGEEVGGVTYTIGSVACEATG